MSYHAIFFTIDWNKRNQMRSDFWKVCLYAELVIKPQYLEWICQIDDFKDSLEYWKVADDFLWYVEAWISLLRDVREKQDWGLIWKIS